MLNLAETKTRRACASATAMKPRTPKRRSMRRPRAWRTVRTWWSRTRSSRRCRRRCVPRSRIPLRVHDLHESREAQNDRSLSANRLPKEVEKLAKAKP